MRESPSWQRSRRVRGQLRFRPKPWAVLAALALLVSVAAFLLWRQRRPPVRTDAEMLGLLPNRDAPTMFVDVQVLRASGVLNLLRSSAAPEDNDYARFVRNTGFDYQRDIETIAARGSEQQAFFVIRGRFDWPRLRTYATQHGGSCNGAFCQVPGSRAGRWISFLQMQPDMAGVALSTEAADVLLLTPRRVEPHDALPAAPVWVTLPHSFLSDPKDWPLPLRLFALAVQPAERVVLSAGPADKVNYGLQLNLEAVFPDSAMAARAKTQLELDTRLLDMELRREHRQASPGDLTGLLTAGTFAVSGDIATGTWPIHRAFLQSLQ